MRSTISKEAHNEIWEATIQPGITRSTTLFKEKEPPTYLLHFTNAEALIQILRTHTLRLTRAKSSNDPAEIDHGIKYARHYVERRPTTDPWEAVFKEELLASFEGRLTDGKERPPPIDPHICCFTESNSAEQIAHWAMYGRSGSGFALRFTSARLVFGGEPQRASLVSVRYGREEQDTRLHALIQVAHEVCEKAADYAHERYPGWEERSYRIAAQAFGGLIFAHAATMKGPEFQAEKEWRLLHLGNGPVPGAEAVGPVIRTYFDFALGPEDLQSVIVGPVHADLNVPVVKRLLKQYGFSSTVETGSVALRTLR